MYEANTYEKLLADILASAPEGVDLRQGSVLWDAASAVAYKMAAAYADLDNFRLLTSIATAVDAYLDDLGKQFAVYRNAATSARYLLEYEGTRPANGERFFNDGIFFRVKHDGGATYLVAEEAGAEANSVLPGTAAVPVSSIAGLTSATFGELLDPGTDTEDDESYRTRIQEKVSGPAANGNVQHYKTWCEETPGVGRAYIIPCFAGDNTVAGVIVGSDGMPPTQTVVDRVQEYIDPRRLDGVVEYEGREIPIGDGLGYGVANIGARFAAIAATAVPINISCHVELAENATIDQATAEAVVEMTRYLHDLALQAVAEEDVVVRISAITTMLYSLPSIIDVSALQINGGTANLPISTTEVATIGEVVLVEGI